MNITCIDENGDNLFSAEMSCCPRIGETIYYSFHATDQSEWNMDSWYHEKALDATEWKVVKVQHEFRRYRIESLPHILFVTLKPKATK